MELDQVVARRIKAARELRGLSQTQAAALLGLSQRTWAEYERGVIGVGVDDLEAIARVLEMPIAYFLLGEAETPNAVTGEIQVLVQELSPSDQRDILDFIRVKLKRQRAAQAPPPAETKVHSPRRRKAK